MATATPSPANAVEALTAGACSPPGFPVEEIRATLVGAGHTLAFWHEDLTEAIEACREQRPDLFLLGAQRPDPRALDCVRALIAAADSTRAILICERSGQG